MVDNVTGLVLAGGKSKRMGRDKRFIEYGGRRLIDITVSRLKSIVNEVAVVTSQPQDLELENVDIITDITYGLGPLMGIYSGLVGTKNPYVLVNPVDTPNIPAELLEYMIQSIGDSDIVIPRRSNRFEPLIAVYSRNVQTVIERIIKDGLTPAPHLLASGNNGLSVKILEEDELEEFGNPEILFENINYPGDLPISES